MRGRGILGLGASLAAAGLLAACSAATPAAETELLGSASYRERMLLPDDAAFSARLLPLQGDAPLAEVHLPQAGQPPIDFTLALPAGAATGRARLELVITGLDRRLFVLDQEVDLAAWAAAGRRDFLLTGR